MEHKIKLTRKKIKNPCGTSPSPCTNLASLDFMGRNCYCHYVGDSLHCTLNFEIFRHGSLSQKKSDSVLSLTKTQEKIHKSKIPLACKKSTSCVWQENTGKEDIPMFNKKLSSSSSDRVSILLGTVGATHMDADATECSTSTGQFFGICDSLADKISENANQKYTVHYDFIQVKSSKPPSWRYQ